MEKEMLTVVYFSEGWCVAVLAMTGHVNLVSGPYQDHANAVQAAETRAYRIRQGWAP